MLCNQGLTKLEESYEMNVANETGALCNFFLALRRKEEKLQALEKKKKLRHNTCQTRNFRE